MSSIDQRILVVAPVEAVWLYLTDPAHISKWHRGAKQLSMLTTRSSSIGARRRMVDRRGRGVVEEMTAWLDNIGFEYTVIDGPYRTFKGRIRLQPVPEGTIVNWTVEYQLRGLLSGLRDALRYRRRMRALMADSLRSLRRLIEASGVRLDPVKQAKFAMQADPGIAARMARIGEPTRAATALSVSTPIIGDDDLPDIPVSAPPTSVPTAVPTSMPSVMPTAAPARVAAPLTSPAVPTLAPASKLTTQTIQIPNFLQAVTAEEDTKPRPPKGLRDGAKAERLNEKTTERTDESASDYGKPANAADFGAPTVSVAMFAPPRPLDPVTQTVAPGIPPQVSPPSPLPELPPALPPLKAPSLDKAKVPPPLEKTDTGEMSIWDVFGLEKPSEQNKAQLDAVIASLQTPPPRPASRLDVWQGGKRARKPMKAHVKIRRLKAASRPKTQNQGTSL